MAIEAVLFDLDNTLMDRHASLLQFLENQWARFTFLQTLSLEAFKLLFLNLDANGSVWKDVVYGKICVEAHCDSSCAQMLLDDYLLNFAKECFLFPHALDTLIKLKARYKIGIITNGREDLQSAVIDACGLKPFMDVILISETEGVKKPNQDIFMKALNILGVRPQNSVYIGDNPIADIQGAYRAGLKAVWFKTDFTQKPNAAYLSGVMKSYSELDMIIEKLHAVH